jgi:hypothetical protein
MMGLSACRQHMALNMSKATKVVKVMVVSRRDTMPSWPISFMYTYSVPAVMSAALVSTRRHRARLRIGSLARRGGRRITAGSTGSTPRLCVQGRRVEKGGREEGGGREGEGVMGVG